MVPTLGRTLILLALLVASAGALVGGRPYFDKMSVPIGVALLFVMGVGPALPWGRATKQQVRRALLPPLLAASVVAVLGFTLGVRNAWTALALFFGGFTARVTLSEILLPVRQRMRAHGEGILEAFRQAQRRGRRRFGAYIVHAGALLVIVAIAMSSTMGTSKEIQLREGETTALGGYTLTFVNADRVAEPHRESVRARMDISKNGRSLGTPYPRMSRHESQREPIGTPASARASPRICTCRSTPSISPRKPPASSSWSTPWWAGSGSPPR